MKKKLEIPAVIREESVALLQRAKEHVAAGWIRGRFMSKDGKRVCALAALSKGAKSGCPAWVLVSGPPTWLPNEWMTVCLAVEYLTRALPRDAPLRSVATWQDMRGRTQVDVLDLYDRAIRLCKDDA